MFTERVILETDPLGNLKDIPKLPPNKQVEAIFIIANEASETISSAHRIPHPDIAGKTLINGDIFNSVPGANCDLCG